MTSDESRCLEGGPAQLLLDACSSGDLSALQHIFREHGIEPGHENLFPDFWKSPKNIPLPDALLESAVAAKQLAIVRLILQTYQSRSLMTALGVVTAVLEHPDPAILQALCAFQPGFASFSMDDGTRSFLTMACRRPPEEIVPVIHVLLDNDAYIYDGFPPFVGILWALLDGNQPMEIVNRILEKDHAGHMFRSDSVSLAIRKGRLDIVERLLSDNRSGVGKEEEIVANAKKTGSQDLITLVQAWALDRAEKKASKKQAVPKDPWWKVWKR